jgi:hypothetical protein
MKFRSAFTLFIAFASLAFGAGDAPKPNIVVILADDFGWAVPRPTGPKA